MCLLTSLDITLDFVPCSLQFDFATNITKHQQLCSKTYDSSKKGDVKNLKFLHDRIHENYMHQWVIDNMPVTWCYSIVESSDLYCTTRFPVGCYITKEGVKHDACYLSVSVCTQDVSGRGEML